MDEPDLAPRRTAEGWLAYDRLNLAIIAALLALTFGAWWWHSRSARAPASAAASGMVAPLELYAARGWVRLSGPVPDSASRDALLQAAGAAFGDDRVIDQLATRADLPALPWLPRAGDIFASLRTSSEPVGIRITAGQVTLSGTVPQAFLVAGLEAQARQWFGRETRLENRLQATAPLPESVASAGSVQTVATPPPATASAPVAAEAPSSTVATSAPAAAPAADNPLCARLPSGIAIGFQPGKPQLSPEGRKQLAEVAPCLAGTGSWRVGGHTDANGDETQNLQLTGARAEQVVAALGKLGIAADRLQAQGLGSSQPVADNGTREGRLANRRISFEPLR